MQNAYNGLSDQVNTGDLFEANLRTGTKLMLSPTKIELGLFLNLGL